MTLSDQQLARYGWNDFFAAHFHQFAEQGYAAGRVALEYNQFYRVYTAEGEILAEIAGRLRHEAESRADLPAVGDWVVSRIEGESATIEAVLPRSSQLTRKAAGTGADAQIIAANVDT